MHIGYRDVAGLEHKCGRPRRETLVGLVDDYPTQGPSDHGDQPLRLEDPKGFPQRRPRYTEPSHQIRLMAEGIAFGQVAGNDRGSDLVGDLLWLLTLRCLYYQASATSPWCDQDSPGPGLRLETSQPLPRRANFDRVMVSDVAGSGDENGTSQWLSELRQRRTQRLQVPTDSQACHWLDAEPTHKRRPNAGP